jgi:hypothetical protein
MLENQVVDKVIVEAITFRLEDTKLLLLGHPNDIVWREAALFFWLQDDKSKSLKFIKRSQNLFSLKTSPISYLLIDIALIYEALFKGKFSDLSNQLNYLKFSSSDLKKPLECVRYARNFSPY